MTRDDAQRALKMAAISYGAHWTDAPEGGNDDAHVRRWAELEASAREYAASDGCWPWLKGWYADVAHVLGVEYATDGHPTEPGPLDVVLNAIASLKRAADERDALKAEIERLRKDSSVLVVQLAHAVGLIQRSLCRIAGEPGEAPWDDMRAFLAKLDAEAATMGGNR